MTVPCNDPRTSALRPAREVAREKAHIRYGIDRGNGPGGVGRVPKRSLPATGLAKRAPAGIIGRAPSTHS
jgi:hypothetical protein